MSVQRSPPPSQGGLLGGSQPELSRIRNDDQLITFRKRKQPENDTDMRQEMSEFRSELMSFLTEFRDSQNENLQKIRDEIKLEIQSQINAVKTVAENLSEEQTKIKKDLVEVQGRVSSVENKILNLASLPKNLEVAHEKINKLKKDNEHIRQYSMLNNVEISGIPFSKGENLISILRSICTRVGFTLAESDIDTIHRVRRFQNNAQNNTRPPAIVARFTQRRRKDDFLAAVRVRRGLTTADIQIQGPAITIYVGDHLTPTNKLLLKRARELKVEFNYQYVWVRDCKIFMRKNDNSKILYIYDDSDLAKIK